MSQLERLIAVAKAADKMVNETSCGFCAKGYSLLQAVDNLQDGDLELPQKEQNNGKTQRQSNGTRNFDEGV